MENRSIEARHKTLVVLWGAMIMSQIMLLVITYVVKPELLSFSGPMLGNNPVIVIALSAVGLSCLGLSFILSSHFKSLAISHQSPQQIQTSLVIACAMCEACSLMGMVLAFAVNFGFFFVLIGLGVLTTLLHFPRRSDLEAASFRKM